MLHPEIATNLAIAVFVLIVCFILAIFGVSVYWIVKRKQRKEKAVSYDHNLEEVKIDTRYPADIDGQDETVIEDESEDMYDEGEENSSNSSFELEESDYHEKIELKAMTEGINLNVQTCEKKRHKLILMKSKQLGFRNQIGVFNKSKMIPKGSLFGPIEEKENMNKFDHFAQNNAYKSLEDGYNWLYLIKIGEKNTSTNVDVIFRDDGEIFYEARKDIPKGNELLADWGWTAIDNEEE